MGRYRVFVVIVFFIVIRNIIEECFVNNQYQRRGLVYIEGFFKFTFLGNFYYGVVEIFDDGIGNLVYRDEYYYVCDDEDDFSREQDVIFYFFVVFGVFGIFYVKDGCYESQEGQYISSIYEFFGCLQVRRESQQGIVDFVLYFDISVFYVIYLQFFLEVFKNYNVVFNEGRYFLLRYDGDSYCVYYVYIIKYQFGDLQDIGSYYFLRCVLFGRIFELVGLFRSKFFVFQERIVFLQ